MQQMCTLIAVCKDALKEREKQKKTYVHYLQKVERLVATREKKKLTNPNYNETANEAERIIRNNRKFDTAKNNYMQADKRCISELENLNVSQDKIIQQIIVSLLHFYRNYFYGAPKSFNLCYNAINNLTESTTTKPPASISTEIETKPKMINQEKDSLPDVKISANKNPVKLRVTPVKEIPEEKKVEIKAEDTKPQEKKITNRKYKSDIGV